MDSSGFFGAIVLAGALEILLLASSTQSLLSANYGFLEAQISEMQDSSFQKAQEELRCNAGSQFDPAIVGIASWRLRGDRERRQDDRAKSDRRGDGETFE